MEPRGATRVRPVRRRAMIGDMPVAYQVAGAGEPLVLVHGLSGSTLWWARNVAALAAGYRIHLVDLPGFGALRRLRRHFALDRAAQWLVRWMDAVALERAHLIGHSMGGLIALRLAASHPVRVDRLVLAAPVGVPVVSSVLREVRPLVAALRHTTPAFLPVLAYDTLRAGPGTLLRATRDILRADVRDELARIAAPTLLIWGDHDTLVPPSAATVMRAALPDARLVMVRGAGHVVMYDRPHAFDDAALRFLAGQPVGR